MLLGVQYTTLNRLEKNIIRPNSIDGRHEDMEFRDHIPWQLLPSNNFIGLGFESTHLL